MACRLRRAPRPPARWPGAGGVRPLRSSVSSVDRVRCSKTPGTRSDGECAFRHDDARAADADALAADLHLDPARSSDGVALLDEHGRAVGYQATCDQAADEWTGGAAGRGILPDADRRVEEPGVRDRGWIDGIQAVHVTALAADVREGRREPWRIGPHAIDDGAIAQ